MLDKVYSAHAGLLFYLAWCTCFNEQETKDIVYEAMVQVICRVEKLADMDEKKRSLLLERYQAGESAKDMAERTGCSRDSVRQKLCRARKKLKENGAKKGGVLCEI